MVNQLRNSYKLMVATLHPEEMFLVSSANSLLTSLCALYGIGHAETHKMRLIRKMRRIRGHDSPTIHAVEETIQNQIYWETE